jgi:hypothetical protein
MTQTTEPPQFQTISGRWVVIALLGFGILATGTLWIYSKMHLAPFLPMRKALDAEFPEAKSRVEGGRPKGKPPLLRVVMQVDFTPTADDERVETIFRRVVALAKEHIPLAEYANFELHIVRYIPEKNPERILIERKVSEL